MIREITEIPKMKRTSNSRNISQNRILLDRDIQEAFEKGIYKFEIIDDNYNYTKITTNQVEESVRKYLFDKCYEEMEDKFNERLQEFTHRKTKFEHWMFNKLCRTICSASKLYDHDEDRYRVFVTINSSALEIIWKGFDIFVQDTISDYKNRRR